MLHFNHAKALLVKNEQGHAENGLAIKEDPQGADHLPPSSTCTEDR
jgi:hypothetical protein